MNFSFLATPKRHAGRPGSKDARLDARLPLPSEASGGFLAAFAEPAAEHAGGEWHESACH